MSLPTKLIRPFRRDQPRQRQAQRRLAGAGFADDAERLAGAQLKIDAVDGLHMIDDLAHEPGLDREPDADIGPLHRRPASRHRQAAARRAARRPGDGGCSRAADCVKTSSTVPVSTILPLVITQTRSANLRTMPRSWVMNSMDMPCWPFSCAQQFEDLRLHGDVERGRRLVGDQQLRPVGERHGDHHALALAAGQLMRIGLQPLFRLADADLVQQFQHRACAPPGRSRPDAARGFRRSASRSCGAD